MTTAGYIVFFVLFLVLAVAAIVIVILDIRLNARENKVAEAEKACDCAPNRIETQEFVLRIKDGTIKTYATERERNLLKQEWNEV